MASRVPFYLSIGFTVGGAIVVILAGVLGWVAVPKIIENRIEDETRLEPGNYIYPKWKDIPIPIYLYVYFFNVTNIEIFEDPNGKPDLSGTPIFEEVGPFAFREIRNKTDISDGPDDTIYFKQNIMYVFDPEASGKDKFGNDLKADTTLNVLNGPFVTVTTLVDIYPELVGLAKPVLDSLLASGESLFVRDVPVDEILFNGFNIRKERNGKKKTIYMLAELIAKMLGIKLPGEILNGEYAFLRARNNTNDGLWQVYRGREDSEKFATIKMVNGTDDFSSGRYDLGEWWSDECSKFNGTTDGTMFPPFVEEDRVLDVYVPEICRRVQLVYQNKTEFEGIKGYRFILPDDLFATPEKHPPNKCYCTPYRKPLQGGCNYNGMFKLHSCKEGVPVVVTKPHYLDADEGLIQIGRSMGMSPNKEKHDSYFDVEPYTGFPLQAHMRIQIGLEVQPYRTYSHPIFDKIPHTYYPILWLERSAELDDELVAEIKGKLVTPLKAVTIVKWTAMGIGVVLALGGAIWFFTLRSK